MSVYVDDANIAASVRNGTRTHTSRWCHMMADSVEELDAFAEKIGLKTRWRQDERSGVHYDLTAPKRRRAVALGAVEVPVRTEQWFDVVAAAREQYKSLQN